jgi:hypothetical protein
MFRPQARKLSQASTVFGADRAELLRVIFINSAKIVALRQSPKVLILGSREKTGNDAPTSLGLNSEPARHCIVHSAEKKFRITELIKYPEIRTK